MPENTPADLPTSPMIVRRGQAPSYAFSESERYDFLFSGFPGQPEIFEGHGSKGDGAPLHRHPWASWEVVLEGSVRFRLGEEEVTLGPGDTIYVPAGYPHTFIIESETARTIGMSFPAGSFEALTREAMPIFRSGEPPDPAKLAELAKRHQVELLGPPMTPSS